MALDRKKHDPKQIGLRGIYSRIVDKDSLTGRSYPEAAKKSASSWATGLAGAMFFLGGAASIAIPLENWGEIEVDRGTNDLSIIQNSEHYVFEGPASGQYWVLFRAEEGQVARDNDPNNDVWRLYSIERDEGTSHRLITLLDDQNRAESVFAYAQTAVDEAQQNVEDGLYFDSSTYYTLSEVSGRFEEDGELTRIFQGNDLQSLFNMGDNLRTGYAALGAFFDDAQVALENGQFAGISAELPAQNARSEFYFGWGEALTVWGVSLGAILAGGLIGGAAGAPIGLASEKINRSVKRRRKKRDQLKPPSSW